MSPLSKDHIINKDLILEFMSEYTTGHKLHLSQDISVIIEYVI